MAHPLIPGEFTGNPEYLCIPLVVAEEPLSHDVSVEELAVLPGEPAIVFDFLRSPIYLEVGRGVLELDAAGPGEGYSVRNMDEDAGGIVVAMADLPDTDDGWGKIIGRRVPGLHLDTTASREHVSIRVMGNRAASLVVKDEGSTNGTIVHTIERPRTDWTRTFKAAI